MKHTKDGKNLNALLRRAMLGVLDIMLFAMANCSICYLTMSGHIMATDYKYMIFNYLHFGLTSVLLVGINSAFGLYRSVWYFAGSDEIVYSAPICAQSGRPTERPKAYYDRGCRIYGQLYH